MGKKSRTKKERKLEKEQKRAQHAAISAMEASPIIAKDMIISYLLTKFIGKSGYGYISIGRYGSLFMNAVATDMVPITLHRDKPVVSVRGRYNDPQRRDLVELCVHAPGDFPGIVIDRQANVYIGGSAEPTSKEDVEKLLSQDLDKVTKEEFDKALTWEQPIIETYLKNMHTEVEEAAKKGVAAIDEAEKKMKEQEAAEEQKQVDELKASETEVVIPEVVGTETTEVVEPTVAPVVQDAEVIEQ